MCGLPVSLPSDEHGDDRDQPEHHRGEQLDRDVGRRRERRQPQLAAPARGALDGHHRAAGGGGQRGPVQRDADHDEGRDVALAGGLVGVGLVQAERPGTARSARPRRRSCVRRLRVSRRTSSPRMVRFSPPRPGARRLAQVGHDGWPELLIGMLLRLLVLALAPAAWSSPSPVRARNASSMPRAVISRSLAGVWLSRYLATASLSRGLDQHRVAAQLDAVGAGDAPAARPHWRRAAWPAPCGPPTSP